jgi:hypothetical protein
MTVRSYRFPLCSFEASLAKTATKSVSSPGTAVPPPLQGALLRQPAEDGEPEGRVFAVVVAVFEGEVDRAGHDVVGKRHRFRLAALVLRVTVLVLADVELVRGREALAILAVEPALLQTFVVGLDLPARPVGSSDDDTGLVKPICTLVLSGLPQRLSTRGALLWG